MRRLLLSVILLCTLPWQVQAQSFQEGVHYQRLTPPLAGGDGHVEVLEFFLYTCPHCYSLEPFVESWKAKLTDGVSFQAVPAVFGASQMVYAKAYYAGEALDVLDKSHPAIFDAIHKAGKKLSKPEDFGAIVAEAGLDSKAFVAAMNSFDVDSKVRKAAELSRAYRLTGVPTMAVNGRFSSMARMAGGNGSLISVVDHLVALETARIQPKTAEKGK